MGTLDTVDSSRQSRRIGGRALAVWREKLDDLLVEEAKASDPNQKWALRGLIDEAKQKIAELGGEAEARPATVHGEAIASDGAQKLPLSPPIAEAEQKTNELPEEAETRPADRHVATDFVLQVGEREAADLPFPVDLLQSPAGSAHSEMPLPFAALELDNHLQNLTIAILRSRGTDRLLVPKELDKVRQFGVKMFDALFAGDIKDRYRRARQLAQADRRSLPIKLSILAGELSVLPWEFLYDVERDNFLALSNLTPLVRYLTVTDPPGAYDVDQPLRILGVLSSPRDGNLSTLNLRQERERVEHAVAPLCKSGDLELHWLPRNTIGELQRTLTDGPWHIFHFVGHGGFDNRVRQGAIAIEDDSGQPLLLTATNLRMLLQDHFSLRLVVLNACDTASGDDSNVFSSMAGELVRHGVPAVLAMQHPISDQGAALFASHFYESLVKGLSVVEALTEGRKAMHLQKDNSLEWGTPVLMTSSPDGRLFQINARKKSVPLVEQPQVEKPILKPPPVEQPQVEKPIVKPPPVGRAGDDSVGLQSPLWKDFRYWQRSELPVRLLVACQDAALLNRLRSLSSQFDRSLPVFEELVGDDHFKTNQSFLFEWRETSPAHLLAEAEDILRQDQIRLVVIVSDGLADVNSDGKGKPSELTQSLRQTFYSQPHQCGLLALVPGEAHRVTEVDRTLSLGAVNRLELRRKVSKIADGLRLKTPPGPASALATDEAISVRLAQSAEEIEECLKLRFQVYERMGYLEEELEGAGRELDCYDTNALHFVAGTREGDIVGTVRLILSRRLGPNDSFDSVVGAVPGETVAAQADWVRKVARKCSRILEGKLNRPPYFGTLPILQSTKFQDNFRKIMSDVERSAELSRLVVAPRYRGVGLSTLLVRAVIAAALSLNIKQVLLECVPAHVRMYKRRGFARIPGTHGRAQELDQEAVGMRFVSDDPMSKARGLANNDLKMIRREFGQRDLQTLFGTKHLCMCAQNGCWSNGQFDSALRPSCPLYSMHERSVAVR